MDTATIRTTLEKNRVLNTRAGQLLTLVFAGLLARVAVAPITAVNGDTGLYIYDAMQISQGKTITVDFPSRSPLMEYFLAALIEILRFVDPLVAVRGGMLTVSVLLGVAIYLLARELFDHETGLIASGLFMLTPFSVVWGVWVKTEQVATLLAIVGIIVALRAIDREDMPHYVMGATGVAFGLAFLVRRSVIVVAGAFGLFFIWWRYREGYGHIQTVTLAATTALAAVVTTFVAYGLLAAHAGGGVELAYRIADTHGLALIKSDGQGSVGWIHAPAASSKQYVESRPGIIWDLCQKCGDNTANVFGHTMFVTLPAALLALVPLRAAMRRFDRLTADTLAPAVFIGPLLYAAYSYYPASESATALAAALGVAVVWFTAPVDWRAFWRPRLLLPLVTFSLLSMGYLYRDRIMYTTYFQDLFPFFVILVAVGLLAWLRVNETPTARIAMAAVLVTGSVAAGASTYPLTDAGDPNSSWFTMDKTDAYGADIDERTDPGDRVFVAQPLYLIHSDARPLADLSRRYYVYRMWPDSGKTAETTELIVNALESGRAKYAVNDVNMNEITSVSPPIRNALAENYCEVDDPLYAETNATLLKHESEGCNE